MKTNKISEVELEVTTEIITPIQTKTTNYKREFIENQIIEITKQRDEMIALKEAELLECQTILAEMDKQGIITEVEFETKQVVDKESLQIDEVIE